MLKRFILACDALALALFAISGNADAQGVTRLCQYAIGPNGETYCVDVGPSQRINGLTTAPLNVTTAAGSPTAFAASDSESITRPANTTTYTANTGWNNATSGTTNTFVFGATTPVCRQNGGQVLITELSFWSSANQSTALSGILWLFNSLPGTIIQDNATFQIASADFTNLTANKQGIPFTLSNGQASGAANAGATVTGPWQAKCGASSQTMWGMVQVTNAYVPVSAEVLNISMHTIGLN